jgi:hypothetical protein
MARWAPGQWVGGYLQVRVVLPPRDGVLRYLALNGDCAPRDVLVRRFRGMPPQPVIDRIVALERLTAPALCWVEGRSTIDGDYVVLTHRPRGRGLRDEPPGALSDEILIAIDRALATVAAPLPFAPGLPCDVVIDDDGNIRPDLTVAVTPADLAGTALAALTAGSRSR